MQLHDGPAITLETITLKSTFLFREVTVDFFLPKNISDPSSLNLLLINDGQNLEEMNFFDLLETLHIEKKIKPLLCAGIHAGKERKMEYGVASQADYMGRGAWAEAHSNFVLKELLPFIYSNYLITSFREKSVAGFSLGGLSALDIVWNHPDEFSKAGIFSGSFWWRSLDQNDPTYDDNKHRIMQQEIRSGKFFPGLKFFFQCGNKDEAVDRNNNGIIDSIDDTMAVIDELMQKGYNREKDIYYLEMPEGRHDVPTWGLAMPEFLKWGWGNEP